MFYNVKSEVKKLLNSLVELIGSCNFAMWIFHGLRGPRNTHLGIARPGARR